MDRFQMLKAIAQHCRTSDFDALYVVSWMSADMSQEQLQQLLDAIHEDQRAPSFQRYLDAVQERFGRQPGSPR